MIAWVIRGVLIISGVVTAWFISKDTPSFGVAQVMTAMLLIVLVVTIVAFWPTRWTHLFNRRNKPG